MTVKVDLPHALRDICCAQRMYPTDPHLASLKAAYLLAIACIRFFRTTTAPPSFNASSCSHSLRPLSLRSHSLRIAAASGLHTKRRVLGGLDRFELVPTDGAPPDLPNIQLHSMDLAAPPVDLVFVKHFRGNLAAHLRSI